MTTPRPADPVSRSAAALAGLAARRPWLVVVLACAITAVALWFALANVAINTNTSDMLSKDLPYRQQQIRLRSAFPEAEETIVVVIGGADAATRLAATEALATRLAARAATVGTVFAPAVEPFFRRNGLLYLDLDTLADLANRLAAAQPFLATLWARSDLGGLAGLLAEVADAPEAAVAPMAEALGEVLARMADLAAAVSAGAPARLDWTRLVDIPRPDGAEVELMTVVPPLDFSSLQPAGAAIAALRAEAAVVGADHPGVTIRLTGEVPLSAEELESVETGMGWAGLVTTVSVALLLWLCLRSLRLVGAVLATLVVGLVLTFGFAIAAVGTLNLISVAFAVLFVGLGVDFAIHYALRYREAQGAPQPEALAAGAIGGPLALTAAAAGIGFLSFAPTDYRGLAELGIISSAGMAIAVFASLTLLPALITLAPPPPRPAPPPDRAHRTAPDLAAVLARRRRAVIALALLLAAGSAALLPQARFDFDPLNLKAPASESVSTLRQLITSGTNDLYAVQALMPDRAAALDLARRWSALPEIAAVRTLDDYVPADQDDKLAIIEGLAFMLLPVLEAAPAAAISEPAALAAARADLVAAARALAEAGPPATRPSAQALAAALAAVPAERLPALQTALVAGLPGLIERLRLALEAGPVTLEDLPPALVARERTPTGETLVTAWPAASVTDQDALARFVDAARAIEPTAVGPAAGILEGGRAVLRAFRDAALIAVIALFVLLLAVLRSLKDTVLVFLPLGLAALLLAALSVLLDLPFNFANVIVLPLLFGLGVASGIHIVTRARAEAVFETSTPRAVLFSALTTIGSFGSISLSGHPGTASMGVMLTLAILLTLGTTFLILPALLAPRPAPP